VLTETRGISCNTSGTSDTKTKLQAHPSTKTTTRLINLDKNTSAAGPVALNQSDTTMGHENNMATDLTAACWTKLSEGVAGMLSTD
jgi:hypothetical protein